MADEKTEKSEETQERHPVHGRDFTVEGNEMLGYVGVGHEYRTYANDTEKPYIAPGELAVIHQGGQLLDIEVDALRERAADNGGVIEPAVVALSMDQAEDRKVTNVVVPEGVTTKEGKTSEGITVDENGKPVNEKSESDKDKADEANTKGADSQTPSTDKVAQAKTTTAQAPTKSTSASSK